jgi:DME family drug/metabolite transporter
VARCARSSFDPLLLVAAAATSGLGFEPALGPVALLVALGAVPTGVADTCYFRGLRTASAAVGVVVVLLAAVVLAGRGSPERARSS